MSLPAQVACRASPDCDSPWAPPPTWAGGEPVAPRDSWRTRDWTPLHSIVASPQPAFVILIQIVRSLLDTAFVGRRARLSQRRTNGDGGVRRCCRSVRFGDHFKSERSMPWPATTCTTIPRTLPTSPYLTSHLGTVPTYLTCLCTHPVTLFCD